MSPPTPNLSLLELEALRKVLTKGGMAELFFNSVYYVVADLIKEAVERDRACRGGHLRQEVRR